MAMTSKGREDLILLNDRTFYFSKALILFKIKLFFYQTLYYVYF